MTLVFFCFFLSNRRGSHILSSWVVYGGCFCVAGIHLSRICLGYECWNLLSLCDGMHVWTDKTSVYARV